MIVLTCISDMENPGYKLLLKSCDYFGLNLKTLYNEGGWKSHRLKDLHVNKYLKTLTPDEVVLFTDGYDTMFVSGEDEILKKYNAIGGSVVFSTEMNCFPHEAHKFEYGVGETKFQYLNSGGYIGTVSALLNLFDKFDTMISSGIVSDNNYRMSNQYLWTKLYLLNRKDIRLDYHCSIFQTFVNRIDILRKPQMSNVYLEEINTVLDDFYIEKNRLYNVVTGSTPSHLHFNGVLFKNLIKTGVLDGIIPWKEEVNS
ncbi:glycosyltransferase domain-containing protein [Sphingobacterium pedocola]|nr:glycosyltransferase domain-containing protein [Sphingobacterium pedocola]